MVARGETIARYSPDTETSTPLPEYGMLDLAGEERRQPAKAGVAGD